MASASGSRSSDEARNGFIKALVSEMCDAGAARGVECEYDATVLAVSPAGDTTRRCFLQVWVAKWEALVKEHGGDCEEEQGKLIQQAVAMFTEHTLAGIGSPGDTITSSEHTSRADPVTHVPKDILPKLRNLEYYSMLREDCRVKNILDQLPSLVTVRLGALPYHAELCEDSEESTAMVAQGKLADWGLSAAEAVQQSLDNLRARGRATLEEWKANMDVVQGKLYVSSWSDSYDAPTLLLTPELRAWAADVGLRGRVVAMPVADHVLLVTGSEEKEYLHLMANVAYRLMSRLPRWLSTRALVLKPLATEATSSGTGAGRGAGAGGADGGTSSGGERPSIQDIGAEWEPYLPEWGPDQPAATLLRVMEKMTLGVAYNNQKALMSHPARADAWRVLGGFPDGDTVHIASFKLRNDVPTSKCVVTQGVRTLLPLADVVALIAVSEGDEEPTTVEELQSRMSLVGQVTWANFAAAMPEGSMTPLLDDDGEEVQPPLFIVSGFPDVGKLSLLSEEDQA